ncbi:hypothetical protein ACJBU6_03239 [Exserohilum turcicum]
MEKESEANVAHTFAPVGLHWRRERSAIGPGRPWHASAPSAQLNTFTCKPPHHTRDLDFVQFGIRPSQPNEHSRHRAAKRSNALLARPSLSLQLCLLDSHSRPLIANRG